MTQSDGPASLLEESRPGGASSAVTALAASLAAVRKRIEESFAWVKSGAGFARIRHRGLARVGWQFTLTVAAYNLVRLPKLLAMAA